MPQFDQGSFLNQVFWFFLFFLNSYFLITYFFLPLICKHLKFRKKKLHANQTYLGEMQLETFQQQLFFNDTFTKIGNHFTFLVKQTKDMASIQIEPLKAQLFQNLTMKTPFMKFYTNWMAYPKYFA